MTLSLRESTANKLDIYFILRKDETRDPLRQSSHKLLSSSFLFVRIGGLEMRSLPIRSLEDRMTEGIWRQEVDARMRLEEIL